MRRIVHIAVSLLFVTLIAAPLVLDLSGGIRPERLSGVRPIRERVELTLATLTSGEYQRWFERWFKEHLSVWGYLVRTDNEINFRVFRQISGGYAASVVRGRDNFLFHREYLQRFNRVRGPSPERVQAIANQLAELQRMFAERGVSLLLLISPSKTGLYPEFVPPAYTARTRESGGKPGSYELFIPALRDAGVAFFDAYEFLKERKPDARFPLFTYSGSHWSDYSACLVTEELVRRIETLIDIPVIRLRCEEKGVRSVPLDFDRDLTEIINVWSPEGTYRPTEAVRHSTHVEPGAARPSVTFIGTSFLWPVLRYVDAHRLFAPRDFYFYFKRLFRHPGDKGAPVDRRAIDIAEVVDSAAVVVLEVNEAWIERVGYGFVGTALRQLRAAAAIEGSDGTGGRSKGEWPGLQRTAG